MKMKKLIAVGAAAAMSMAMCVNVFAETAVATSAKVNDAKTGISLVNKGTDLSASDKQYTVVIFKEGKRDDGTIISASNLQAGDIEYINQGLVGEEFWANMLTKNAITDGTYVVRIGGDNGAVTSESGVYEYTVKLQDKVLYGDANLDKKIDGSDATVILLHSVGITPITDTVSLKSANANRDKNENGTDKVDGSDATAVLLDSVGIEKINQEQ